MHKVVNVQELFDDSVALYDDCIVSGSSSADAILGDLYAAYENLKNCWEGKDAGVQINNIVLVYNELVGIRNALAKWAESATKVAADYRDVQNSNGAGFDSFVPVRADEKYKLAEYSDNRDTINIGNEANNGKAKLSAASGMIDTFLSNVTKYYDLITNNWTMGPGRDDASDMYSTLKNSAQKYREDLEKIENSVTTAIQNYGV